MEIKFVNIRCNLCGEEKYKHLVKCKIEKSDTVLPIDYMSLVKCSNCGLVYVNPMPKYAAKEITEMYSEEYFDAPYMRFYMEKEGGQSNESFELRLEWIGQYKKSGKILDIGCASGGFLRLAKSMGWNTYGVEISDAAAKIAREKYWLNVTTGQLEDAGFEDGYFDVVTAGDVLEHVENPKSFLLEINRILKKDGIIYVAVPNFDGFLYTVSLIVAKINHRNYFTLPHHIYNFNNKTISQYMQKTGFKILDFKKSESNISARGFKGKMEGFIFFMARLLSRQDRIFFIARKETQI